VGGIEPSFQKLGSLSLGKNEEKVSKPTSKKAGQGPSQDKGRSQGRRQKRAQHHCAPDSAGLKSHALCAPVHVFPSSEGTQQRGSKQSCKYTKLNCSTKE